MGATADLVRKLIEKYRSKGLLLDKKEELMAKLDLFLLMDRISDSDYRELKALIDQGE